MTHVVTSRRRRGRLAAFTLVEVLATLALAAIILPPVVRGILLCLEVADTAKDQAEAAALAQSKLAELVATNDLNDAETTGNFGNEAPGFDWKAELSDWTDDRLEELDVTVSWTRRSQQRQVTVSTLVYTGQPVE